MLNGKCFVLLFAKSDQLCNKNMCNFITMYVYLSTHACSLPPLFLTYTHRHFIYVSVLENISMLVGCCLKNMLNLSLWIENIFVLLFMKVSFCIKKNKNKEGECDKVVGW